ncbi:unnamed protein product [Cylindrotheca closterium]|uniref:Coenzyme Q-binding protein COQ10 START domain-containing protein n=1 Tax=Cylindrotheca closterium TaxID=2856 RepID=A0AAD2CYZ6_9STRA|nr:unnamed protein product [Cylindrotheca closterium]
MKSIRRITALSIVCGANAFVLTSPLHHPSRSQASTLPRPSQSSSALNVWWFGGNEHGEVSGNDDSCELVAVRIERTSANSRRIAGEIVVPCRLEEVWSILTDYDRLSIHVPNLMESKIRSRNSGGEPGDGNFRCRLYQVGAQKIIGFDFSASVTMDMTEGIVQAASTSDDKFVPQERLIGFKCVDSQFFSTFDGDWRVKEQISLDGEIESVVSYEVDVRPKGPVPVAALEWRIREDVPTNLRAVKAATVAMGKRKTLPLGADGVMQARDVSSIRSRSANKLRSLVYSNVDEWDRDETMAKYL